MHVIVMKPTHYAKRSPWKHNRRRRDGHNNCNNIIIMIMTKLNVPTVYLFQLKKKNILCSIIFRWFIEMFPNENCMWNISRSWYSYCVVGVPQKFRPILTFLGCIFQHRTQKSFGFFQQYWNCDNNRTRIDLMQFFPISKSLWRSSAHRTEFNFVISCYLFYSGVFFFWFNSIPERNVALLAHFAFGMATDLHCPF